MTLSKTHATMQLALSRDTSSFWRR